MIPAFPAFKKLELSDHKEVEKFTKKISPCSSDFNFAGTWSWDVQDSMQISQLHENYIIRFINYVTGEPFYTYLGTNKTNETLSSLLDLSLQEKIEPEVKLILERYTEGIDRNIFTVDEDRDNFDYIYDLEELKNFKGHAFESKRGMIHRFLRKYPEATVKTLSLGDPETQQKIINLYKTWVDSKTQKDEHYASHEEIVVIERFFLAWNQFETVSTGVFVDHKLVAFSINELTDEEYVMSHVVKADDAYTGIYAYLMQETAKVLHALGRKYLNFEQDLGIPSLRQAKTLFRPSFFLRKYIIKYKHN